MQRVHEVGSLSSLASSTSSGIAYAQIQGKAHIDRTIFPFQFDHYVVLQLSYS